MSGFDTLKQLFEKCKLSENLSPETKKVMLDSKKEVFIKIMKSQAKYGFLMFFIVTLFFGIKRFGITLSIVKSSIVVITLAVFVTAGLISGSYFLVQHIVFSDQIPEKEIQNITPDNGVSPNAKKKTSKMKRKTDYKLDVFSFSSEGIDRKKVNRITDKIIKQLNLIKGKNTAKLSINDKKINKYNRRLLGSVVQIDKNIMITAKIINVHTSKVIFYITEETDSIDKIDKLCDLVAQKISRQINW